MNKYLALFLLLLSPTFVAAQDFAIVSSASFAADFPVAPESIVSAFGQNFAPGSEAPNQTPLPTQVLGVSVTITDSTGASHLCPIFFMSPGQINFLIPAEVALGAATARISGHGADQTTSVEIASVSTGLYTQTDLDWMSGFILKVDADGTQTFLPTVQLVGSEILPVPLQMSPGGDESAQFYLILYGTGNRGSGDLSQVRTYIDFNDGVGSDLDLIPTLYNGPQGQFVGLDQTNAGPIPRRMEWFGGGDRAIGLEVDGDFSNLAWIEVAPNPNAPVISNPVFEFTAEDPTTMTFTFDFTDADGDVGPFDLFIQWEDDEKFCAAFIDFDDAILGQTAGSFSFTETKNFDDTDLGPIRSVTMSITDAAGHVSNELIHIPEPAGAIPGFNELCDDVFFK